MATKKSTVKLLSYSVELTIPTGQYANIRPRIEIEAPTIEQAEEVVMAWVERWTQREEYTPQQEVTTIELPEEPQVSETYTKARQLLETAKDKSIIIDRVKKSEKLTTVEKANLMSLYNESTIV